MRFAQAQLGLTPPEDWDLPSQVDFCWSRWHEGNVLVVLDDVNDYPKVEPYLPPQPSRFKVLITTRLQLDLPQSLTLDVLDESAALELLREWVGEEKISHELADAKQLCQRLGYLPLALNLVGRYVKKRKISLAEMLRRLEKKGLKHESLERDKNDPLSTLNVKRGVAPAFELSWEQLSENAKQLGCVLSLFALAPIPWSLVESLAITQDYQDLQDASVELESLHLVQGKETYRLNQLIRKFFQEKLAQSAEADELKRVLAVAMAEVAEQIPDPRSINCELIAKAAPAMPHVAEAATNLTAYLSNETLIYPFQGLGRFYESQGLYEQAEYWYEQSLAITQSRLGSDNLAVAISLSNLGGIYLLKSRYKEAESWYLQALEIFKRLRGDEDTDIALILNHLAHLYTLQGRYVEAEVLALQALELFKCLRGDEHTDVALVLNNLGELYRRWGRHNEAESPYIKALELRQRLLEDNDPRVAMSLNNLAELYREQRRYSEAETLYLKAIELYERLLGYDHPELAVSLNNLANLYFAQCRYSEAELIYLQSLEILQGSLGEDHYYIADSLRNLARLYGIQGRYSKAKSLYVRAIEIAKLRLGAEHPWTVEIRKNFKLLEVKYQEKLQQYEQEFSKVIQQQYPLRPETRDELQRFQEKLSLRKEDIAPIEARIKTQINSAHIKEIRSAIGGRLIQDYRQLARAIIQRMGATAPALIESPKFEIGTVWKVLLPLIGLRLRTQKAVLFLRQREESNNTHEYLAEITFDENAAFLIVVDLVNIRRPPIEVASPTIWFRPESLIEMATMPENELLGWLGRFITTQIDICALPGLLPYQITGAAKELFFGRDYELTRLIGGTLCSGIIVGAHRSGKTSLLHQLGKRLEQRDCQVVGVLTLGGIESFQSFFERTLEPLDIDFPEQMTPASWASALRAYGKNNQSPVFLLDEVDDLISLDTQSEFTLGKQMRSLQSDGQCEFYLAGHAKLRQAIEVEGGPFRNFAEEITLTGLTETASMRLIQQPMKLIGFEVTDDQARQIYEGTAGVAVLIQEFCIRLLRGLRQVNTSYIEDAEIEKIEQSPEYLSVVFEHYKYAQEWDSLAVLLLTTILEEVKKRDIIKALSKQGASLTASRLDKILEFLVRFGVLEEFKAGEYRVLPGYLCHAIQARDPDLLLESALEQGCVKKPESGSKKATQKKGMEWLVAKAKSFFTN
ncbi:MAG TPA: tetratricopeptide repeat protein [Stenomitos sp.]